MAVSPKRLTTKDLEKLVKLLRMLGAPEIGERASAAQMVDKFIKDYGLDVEELIFPPEPPPPPVTVTVGKQTVNQVQQAQLKAAQAAQAMAEQALQEARAVIAVYVAAVGPVDRDAAGRLQLRWPTSSSNATAARPRRSATSQPVDLNVIPDWPNLDERPPFVDAILEVLTHHRRVLKGDREAGFLHSIIMRGNAYLTDRQAEWAADICGRAGLIW